MNVTRPDVEKTIAEDITEAVNIIQDLLTVACTKLCFNCEYKRYCIHDEEKQ